MTKARYIMVGGFLGAGKTTAVAQLARHLEGRGLSVGLITNDQSSGLVDSQVLEKQGYSVEEIAGGCFCCRFHSLDEAVQNLTARTRPDVFLAEPVGSCTDLLATVSYPLRRIYGDHFTVAPLSVLVDPLRAARILGLEKGKNFSSKVVYVYEKQLEEARTILVNKVDAIDDELRARLVAALEQRYPRAEVLCISARDGTGLDPWYERILGVEVETGPTLDIDYERYAEGEARLGWLNCTVAVRGTTPFDANRFVVELAMDVRATLSKDDLEIAHLKLTLDAEVDGGQLAVVSVVGTDREPDVRESLLDRVCQGSLVINLRAEADPELLRRAVGNALAARSADLSFTMEHSEVFRPAAPVPVHREAVAEKAVR